VDRAAVEGVATLILDNAGHEEKQRPRGTSAKADLNEVVFVLRTTRPFDRTTTGELAGTRTHSRFSEIEPAFRMTLGGGVYDPPTAGRPASDPIETAVIQAVEDQPGMTTTEVVKRVTGKTERVRSAVARLVEAGILERHRVPKEDAMGRGVEREVLFPGSQSQKTPVPDGGTRWDAVSSAASGDTESPERPPPVGRGLRDAVSRRDPADLADSVPGGCSGEAMVDLLAEAFDAVELSEKEWSAFEASHHVETLDLTS